MISSGLEKIIRDSGGVFCIAEIGKNFIQTQMDVSQDEYLSNAKSLILEAKKSGADAVKFQTHNLDDEQADLRVVSHHFKGSDRYSWIKRNEAITTKEFWREINDFSKKNGIIFFSTPMSRGAALKLSEIDPPIWKVGSGDLLDLVLLDYLAQTKKPIIISTGMSTLREIDIAVKFLKERQVDLALLYCVSKYPADPSDFDFSNIAMFSKRYGIPIGFSDHSLSTDTAIKAVKSGALIIEKHFSSDRNHWGSDHKVSMLPQEFLKMTEKIRSIKNTKFLDITKQNGLRELSDDELKFRELFRKTIVAARDLEIGETISQWDIVSLRPQKFIAGFPSEMYEYVLGKTTTTKIKKFQGITGGDIS